MPSRRLESSRSDKRLLKRGIHTRSPNMQSIQLQDLLLDRELPYSQSPGPAQRRARRDVQVQAAGGAAGTGPRARPTWSRLSECLQGAREAAVGLEPRQCCRVPRQPTHQPTRQPAAVDLAADAVIHPPTLPSYLPCLPTNRPSCPACSPATATCDLRWQGPNRNTRHTLPSARVPLPSSSHPPRPSSIFGRPLVLCPPPRLLLLPTRCRARPCPATYQG